MSSEKSIITVTVPGSKSVINRMLILATMYEGCITLHNASNCDDVQTMCTALSACGLDVSGTSTISVKSNGVLQSGSHVFVQDAGTVGRFLLARAAAQSGCQYRFVLGMQLRHRPFLPLISALRKMGAEITSTTDGFDVRGTHLRGGDVYLDGSISSQFASALLMIAPLCIDELRIHISHSQVSHPYITMTTSLMRRYGVKVIDEGSLIRVPAGQRYLLPDNIQVEPDYSSAGCLWALGAIGSQAIRVSHCAAAAPIISLQPDAGFTDILQQMGARILEKKTGTTVYPSELNGVEVSMSDMPDQVPTLAVLALFAKSPTRIFDIHHLVHKESNRIAALQSELQAFGASISYQDGALEITPFRGYAGSVTLHTHNDHRMAMALGLLLVKFPQLSLDAPQCVSKSYPEYWQELQRIGLLLDIKKSEHK